MGVPGANFALRNGSPSTTDELTFTSVSTGKSGFRPCRSRKPTEVGGVIACGRDLMWCPFGTKHGKRFSARRENFLPLWRGSGKNFSLAALRSGLAKNSIPCNGGIKPGGKASQLKSDFRFTPTGVTVAFVKAPQNFWEILRISYLLQREDARHENHDHVRNLPESL